MYKTRFIIVKCLFIASLLMTSVVLSACSAKRANGDGASSGGDANGNGASAVTVLPELEGALAREDFNFYSGKNIINADDEDVYGGTALKQDWSTARGYKYGDDLQEFALLYNGLHSIITVTSIDSETAYYPDAVINELVADISEENCNSVSFVFVFEGYTLTFDYSTHNKEFHVITRGRKENGRLQAFNFLTSVCQYHLFSSYSEMWPAVGHLPWAHNVDEMEYLNERNDRLNEEERVFMYEKGEEYLESYGIPPSMDEQRAFLSSFSDSEMDMFDSVGQKIWNWVQTSLSV